MATIYLVRHAEVQNPKRLIYGRLGFFKLSQRGLEQAEALGKYFKNKNIELIYSSPLLRARQTAREIAAKTGAKIKLSNNLIEANYTKWEGKPYSDRPKKDMELYLNTPTKLRAGETLDQIATRITKEINLVTKRHPGKNIVLISHADPIVCARLFYEKKSLDLTTKTRIKKASITSLEFNKDLQCKKVSYREIIEAEEESP